MFKHIEIDKVIELFNIQLLANIILPQFKKNTLAQIQ